ncbi:MAG: hypothetical protein IJ480_04355 [Clostridia bacterium]|nr:hypothetical protein [Clostridia bacterium]
MKSFFILVFLLAVCTSCGTGNAIDETYSFALQWGYDGMYSYDSTTGELVKGANVSQYVLTEAECLRIQDILRNLDVQSYPDEYNPNENLATSPPMTLLLTVRTEAWEKTITAKEIASCYASEDRRGQRFLDVFVQITEILERTAVWNAMPDVDLFYLE